MSITISDTTIKAVVLVSASRISFDSAENSCYKNRKLKKT